MTLYNVPTRVPAHFLHVFQIIRAAGLTNSTDVSYEQIAVRDRPTRNTDMLCWVAYRDLRGRHVDYTSPWSCFPGTSTLTSHLASIANSSIPIAGLGLDLPYPFLSLLPSGANPTLMRQTLPGRFRRNEWLICISVAAVLLEPEPPLRHYASAAVAEPIPRNDLALSSSKQL